MKNIDVMKSKTSGKKREKLDGYSYKRSNRLIIKEQKKGWKETSIDKIKEK